MTILVTLICIAQGTALGLVIGLARLAEARHYPARQICRYALRWPSTVYVSFFRGTPLFVQILLIHFAVLPLFINPVDGLLISGEAARNLKQNYGAFISGVLALTLNSGAYISEIFRAGIQSIDRGQIEASRSLGLSFARTMYHVVLPQAFRRMLPPLGNNAIALLKDSSLISAIGLAELAYTARTVAGAYSRYWEPYLSISLMYWTLTLGLAWAVKRLEARYGRGDTR
jgi:polar amino acid transport system permease protein